MPKKNNEKANRREAEVAESREEGKRRRGRGEEGVEEEERRDSWQGSSAALVITQWLNQLTPLDTGRGRLALPRHAHTVCCPKVGGLLAWLG